MSEPTSDSAAKRRFPAWGWILIVVALAAIVALVVLLVVRPGVPATSDPSGEATEPTPTAVGTSEPTPTQIPTPAPTSDAALDADLIETFLAALNSGNTAIFAQGGYFSDPIQVVAAASDLNEALSPVDAVAKLDPLLSLDLPEPWALATPEALETYRAGPYASYFPEGAIVVESTTGHVVSFIGSGRDVTTLFFATVADSLLP